MKSAISFIESQREQTKIDSSIDPLKLKQAMEQEEKTVEKIDSVCLLCKQQKDINIAKVCEGCWGKTGVGAKWAKYKHRVKVAQEEEEPEGEYPLGKEFENIQGHSIVIYDNGGSTVDRYIIIIDDCVYNMSGDPKGNFGVNQYNCDVGDLNFDELRKDTLVKFKDVPEDVQKSIIERFNNDNEINSHKEKENNGLPVSKESFNHLPNKRTIKEPNEESNSTAKTEADLVKIAGDINEDVQNRIEAESALKERKKYAEMNRQSEEIRELVKVAKTGAKEQRKEAFRKLRLYFASDDGAIRYASIKIAQDVPGIDFLLKIATTDEDSVVKEAAIEAYTKLAQEKKLLKIRYYPDGTFEIQLPPLGEGCDKLLDFIVGRIGGTITERVKTDHSETARGYGYTQRFEMPEETQQQEQEYKQTTTDQQNKVEI